MPVANNTRSKIAGVQHNLAQTWRQEMPAWKKAISYLVKWLPSSNLRKADWVFKESLPAVSLWPYGTKRTFSTFRDRYLTSSIYNYTLNIPFSEFDANDDQIGDMKEHVNSALNRYKQLPIRMASEYFNASYSLSPAAVNAYDGAGLFSATDGASAARLGVTGGNIVTGSGLTAAGIATDIAAAQRRFLDMQDPAGQPLYDMSMVEFSKLRIIAPNALNAVMRRVSEQEYIRVDALNNTSESNYLKSTFAWECLAYLTDSSDWYVCLDHPYYKPFVYRAISGEGELRSIIADYNNSDHARDTGEYVLYTDTRVGIVPYFPGSIIKINN
jgi:hypothetical protein